MAQKNRNENPHTTISMLSTKSNIFRRDTSPTLDPQDSVSSLFTVLEEGPGPCIFTEESLRWARGHFLSRRFPATMPNLVNLHRHAQVADGSSSIGSKKDHHHHHHHLAGYGDATSMFIPVLDLMNHTPMRNNACSLKMTPDGMHLQVFSGDLALQCGDELFYCYSSAETGGLSNEILLQGYGFCLADNPADTVSVKISTMDGEQCRGGNAFWIGRGGVSLRGLVRPHQANYPDHPNQPGSKREQTPGRCERCRQAAAAQEGTPVLSEQL